MWTSGHEWTYGIEKKTTENKEKADRNETKMSQRSSFIGCFNLNYIKHILSPTISVQDIEMMVYCNDYSSCSKPYQL